MDMEKELKKEMKKKAKDYDRSAYCGHFAGEDPSYHFEVGAQWMYRKLNETRKEDTML